MNSGSERPLTLSYEFGPARITVYDRLDRVVFEGVAPGRRTVTLKTGLYVVRVESAGSFREDLLRHDGTVAQHLVRPTEVAAAAPVRSSSLRHEYYEGPLRQLGSQPNHGALRGPPHEGRLVVMVRALADGSTTMTDVG